MKAFFFFILFLFVSCTLTPNTGQTDSSPIVVIDPKITALEKRATISEARVTELEKKLSALTIKFSKDSALQWSVIKSVTPLTPEMKQLTLRFTRDSARQWVYINSVLPLIPQMTSLTNRFKSDSVKQWLLIKASAPLKRFTTDSINQWVAIKKLQSASPVTQIPIIQSQIKIIQAKDLSQDKILVAHTSEIKNINDTISELKVIVGPDFTLDANKKLIISKSGIDRIKASMPQQ